MTPVLSVQGLCVALPPGAERQYAVQDVALSLTAGEVLCIVGESGSGKSVTASAIMGLLPNTLAVTAGSIMIDGQDILRASAEAARSLRGRRVAMIFQEPMTALNPVMPVGRQIAEVMIAHGVGTAETRRQRTLQLLADIGLPDPGQAIDAYPFRLSGGQRQRVMIAMALALDPAVLVADEPTTALDVTTQAQILTLIRGLQRRKGAAVLFITHDFGVVADIADHVVVMRDGRIVEAGPRDDVLDDPQHAYTKRLIAAVPGLSPQPSRPAAAPALLELRGVSKSFQRGGLFARRAEVRAVHDLSVTLARGETLGLVGESGSGKSTLARCVMRLYKPSSGAILFDKIDIATLRKAEMKPVRKRMQMVFQDPFASLNPRQRIGDSIAAGPIAHGERPAAALAQARTLLGLVGLDAGAALRYPHEFSGGQRQRICLARALALDPELLVADEPVSALDVSVQAQVLALMADLKARLGLTMLFITHDLRIASQICDRIAVMRHGEIVEQGSAADVFGRPQSDYTRALLEAIPGRNWERRRIAARAATA